jgi:hypothetical protein
VISDYLFLCFLVSVLVRKCENDWILSEEDVRIHAVDCKEILRFLCQQIASASSRLWFQRGLMAKLLQRTEVLMAELLQRTQLVWRWSSLRPNSMHGC